MPQIAFYGALLAAITLGVIGQLLLKTGVERTPGFLPLLLDPFTLLGLVFYGAAAVLYIIALKRIPLSIALPSASLSYIVVALAAHYIWHEPLGWPQLTGIALIASGLVMLQFNS